MFSGGRDSTIAALRLIAEYQHLVLVTVTSEHLVGIQSVHVRLFELRAALPGVEWLHVKQPRMLAQDDNDPQTCLPCHLAYTAVGAAVLGSRGASDLAFGYTAYQADWPEQTPSAILALRRALNSVGASLILPTSDLSTKKQAISELERRGISGDALEQKCLLQKLHRPQEDEVLQKRLDVWETSLRRVVARPPEIEIVDFKIL